MSDSHSAWVKLENDVQAAAAIMMAGDLGAKMRVASRIQTLAEDLQMALEREDESD